MASLYLSRHCLEDNIFFSISAPGIALSLPFPKSLHLAECGVADLRFLIIMIPEKQPLPAQGADVAPWAALQGWAFHQPGQLLAGLPWDTGVYCGHGLFCVKCHMSAGERKNQRVSHLDPLVCRMSA